MLKASSKKLLLLASVIAVFMACQEISEAPQDEEVLAQIGDLYVSTTHFENAFREYYYRTGQVITPDERTKAAILNSEFNTYVLSVHAEDLGLDESEFAKNKLESIKRRVITEEFLNQRILASVEVEEKDLLDYYIRFNSSLRASHIYARTKELAEEYYDRIQAGESFEELAKEAFENPYLSENGGDIGRFTTDDLDIAFENAAFALDVGEISEPIQTAQGYSIIKLTDRVVKPILTEFDFAQKKNQIQSYVRKKKNEVATREHLSGFIGEVELNEEAVENLWNKFDKNYELMLSKDMEFVSTLNSLGNVLASFDGFKFAGKSFAEEYLASSELILSNINSKAAFDQFFLGIAYRSYLMEKAKESGIDTQELVQESIEETYHHFLADEVMFMIESEIRNTPAELYNSYLENQNNYYKPLEVNLKRIVLDSEERANEILDLINKGESFSALVDTYTIKSEDRFTNGELGFESIKNYGFSGNEIALLEVGDVSGVIQYSAGEFHIYKCLGREESKPLSFAEAQPQVNDFLTKKKVREIKAETIEMVKEKHNAVINTAKLKELIIQI